MKRLFLVLFLVFASVCSAAPVATATVGETTATPTRTANPLWMLSVDWLSSSTGACTASISDVYGTIERVTIAPDTSTSTWPTASYDMTLSDVDGFDVLIGHGANLSSSTVTSFASMVEETTSSGCMPVVVMGTLSLAITNAGDQKGGIIRLYMRP